MEPNNIELFIFDMDGLLVDSERVYSEGWKYAFEQEHLPYDQALIDSWSGKSWLDCQKDILERYHDQDLHDRLRAHREEYIYQSLENGNLKAKPYAKEAIEALKRKGKKIAVATSCRTKRMRDILSKVEIFPLLDLYVTADDTTHLKPEPDVYELVLKKAGVDPDQALAFEDSKTGVQAANAAGIYTIVIPDLHPIEESEIKKGKIANDLSIVFEYV